MSFDGGFPKQPPGGSGGYGDFDDFGKRGGLGGSEGPPGEGVTRSQRMPGVNQDAFIREIVEKPTSEPGASSPEAEGDPSLLREWWEGMLRADGKYPCYALPLILPRDEAFYTYLTEDGLELHQLSGDNCYVMILTDDSLAERGADDATALEWTAIVDNYLRTGIASRLITRFDLTFEEYPALAFFEDIRSSEYFLLPLKDLDRDGIGRLMRKTFGELNEAIRAQERPLEALVKTHRREIRHQKTDQLLGGLRYLGGITLVAAVQDIIKKMIG
jgi:hypothetical protein